MENKKIKILLIEDSIDDAALITRKLEKSTSTKFQVAVAHRLNEALAQAAKTQPDLILSDLGLPDSHGIDTVTKILLTLPHIPLVVLSGFDDEDIAVKAVQLGAQDYLVKGQLDDTQLERSLFYSIERAHLQDQLEENTWEVSKLHSNLLKIMDNSTDAILVVSKERKILFTNSAVGSLFGRKTKEMLHLPFQYPLDVGKTTEITIHRVDEKITIADISVVGITWEGKPSYLVSMHDITERKAMEEAMRSSEEKYRTIVEMAHDGIITVNLQGQITSCNEAFARLGATTVKEIIGKHFSEIPFVIPKDIASHTKIFTSLLSGEKIPPLEITWPHTDGTTRVIELRASLMKHDDKIVGIQAMIIDITERKRKESLQQAENLVLTLLGQGAELSEILDAIIHMCEQNDPTIKGSIMLYDASKNWLSGSGPSIGEEYNSLLKTGIPVMDNVGSCGTAAYRRERVVVRDLKNSPFFKPSPEVVAAAKRNGLHACWSEPIISSDGNLLGTIANYSDHVGEPTFDNIRILEWSARVAAIAIERKHTEKALGDSEEKFSKAFMASPQAIVITGMDDGIILEANETFLQLTGFNHDELIGKKAIELDLWNSPEEREIIIKTLNEKRIIKNLERQFITKSGELRTWLFSAEIITIDSKPCMLSVTIDITERKRMEYALREREKRFSDIADNTLEWIWEVDANGKYTYSSPVVEKILGYKPEEILEKHFYSFFLPEEREELKKAAIEVFNQKQPFSEFINRNIHKNGKTVYLMTSGVPIFDNEGNFIGYRGVDTDITERKKTEEVLRFSDIALKSIHEGIFAQDNEFKITRWNEMCEQIFGIKATDAIGKIASDVFTMVEEYEGQNQKRIDLLLEKGFNIEEQIYRTPRGDVWVDVSAQAIEDNGKRTGWVTLISDITERKKTEAALKQSEEKYRELINTSTDAIISADPKMKITIWNKGAERIFWYSEKEMLGQSVLKIVPEMTHEQMAENYQNYKITGTGGIADQVMDLVGIRKDGVRIPIELAISTRKVGDSFIATAIIRDVTTRKEAEEALKQSEEKYRELINTSTDAIISTDPQSNIAIWNKGAEKLLGYKEKEMVGHSIMTIFPTELYKDISREIVNIKNADKTEFKSKIFESSGLRKDCSIVPIEVSLSTRKADNSDIITTIIRNITVRKEAEEKLKKIDQMKSEFLSNVSHELRTPLQSIGGFTKLIMNGKVPDPAVQQEFLQIIDRETMHLGNLINGLLDMTRLEAGRFQIYKKLTPVYDIFTDSINMFHSLAREKEITLSENIAAKLPEMEVDTERMRQVVINLLGNAIKFSDPGTSINVKAAVHNNELLFQVNDHGTGMREEAMRHLFERFYRVEGETVRGGTGLGLYISKQIIDAHGGRIWAESKFGEGSTFSFTLPINNEGGKGNGKENTGNRRRSSHAKTGRLLSKARGV